MGIKYKPIELDNIRETVESLIEKGYTNIERSPCWPTSAFPGFVTSLNTIDEITESLTRDNIFNVGMRGEIFRDAVRIRAEYMWSKPGDFYGPGGIGHGGFIYRFGKGKEQDE